MRILILTCNTGEGHNSAAYAIKEEFEKKGELCDISDALSYVSQRLSNIVASCHSRIYRHVPRAFGKGYSFSEHHESIFSQRRLIYRGLSSGVSGLHETIVQGGYDLIICVHAFSAIMTSEMKKRYGLDIATCFVSTDYTCSPSVAESNMDIYFIAHEGLYREYEANGIPRERLIPSGIPVRSIFHERLERQKAKAQTGISPDCRNVLIMCGSMGCGPVENLTRMLVKRLPENCSLIVVCGTNEKLFHTLSWIDAKNLKVLGYTHMLPQLLSASEIILTKPGGLSISEAAAKRTPMLLIDVVGGCEHRNLEFFLDKGWGETYQTSSELVDACVRLIDDPAKLKQKVDILENDFQTRPAEIICEASIKLLESRTELLVKAIGFGSTS